MNDCFINVTTTLNLKKQFSDTNGDPSEFDSHISIKAIHEKYPEIIPEIFNSKLVSNNDVKKETENLDINKSATYGSIAASILKRLCMFTYYN